MIDKLKENSLFLSLLFLGIILLTIQLETVTLRSVDGAVYSSMGRELTEKPFLDWIVLTFRGGEKFYENPHFMPFFLATFIKVFGVGAVSVVLPAVLLSIGSLIANYKIGKLVLDQRFGLLSMFCLLAIPQFIKEGRNPMLETALMMFTLWSIYFGLRSLKETKKWSLVSGIVCGFAFLSKGPISFLAPAVILSMALISKIKIFEMKDYENDFKDLMLKVLFFIIGFSIVLGVIDIWHLAVTGTSFWKSYYEVRLLYTMNHPTAALVQNVGGDHLFYLKMILKKHIPWVYVALIAPVLFFFYKNKHQEQIKKVYPALIVGMLMFWGYLFGFSIITFKAPWYMNTYFGGLALLSAVSIYLVTNQKFRARYLVVTVNTIAITLLFLSSSFPSIFKSKKRVFESFLIQAQKNLGNKLKGHYVKDCISIGEWRGPFIVHYFLGAKITSCESNSQYSLVNLENYNKKNKILYSVYPIALVTNEVGAQ